MHCAQVNYALKRWTRFLKSENIFILVLQEFLTNAVLELLTRMKTSFDMLLLLISLSGSNCYFFSFPYQVQIATSSHFLIRFKLLLLLISLSGSNCYYFSFPYQVQIATSSHFFIRFKLLLLLISLSGLNCYFFSFPYQVQIATTSHFLISFKLLLLLISLSGTNCYFFSFPYQVQIATSSHFLIRFKLLQLLISLSGSNRYYFSFPYQVQIFYRVTHTVCYWKDNRAEFTLLSFCSFKTVNLFVFLCQIIKYKIIWNVETKILHLDRYSYCRNKSFILCG